MLLQVIYIINNSRLMVINRNGYLVQHLPPFSRSPIPSADVRVSPLASPHLGERFQQAPARTSACVLSVLSELRGRPCRVAVTERQSARG